MSLRDLLIPPTLDGAQALRLRRFALAAFVYGLSAVQVAVVWAFGFFPASATPGLAAAALAVNLGLYLVIRSGLNLRFKDPSLARVQMLIAITFLMVVLYHMDDGRDLALFGCFFVLLFGIYRLNARDFTLITLYTLAVYALVINLLMNLRPEAIHDVRLEWLSWLILACWLPLFNFVAGQISTLKQRVRESELRFRSLNKMSSDYYWESDVEHRLAIIGSGGKTEDVPTASPAGQAGQHQGGRSNLSRYETDWRIHHAVLDAHRPFRDFEIAQVGVDATMRHISLSGDPVFDSAGLFAGYRGVGTDITARKQADEQIQHYVEKLKRGFMSTVRVVTTLAEMRDPYRAGHERRVAEIAAAIGAELGLDEQHIEGLRVVGYLHDVGTFGIPAEILARPSKLKPLEFDLVKAHSQTGYEALKDVEFPWAVAEVIFQHHECVDGSGYPQGLKGDAILLEARIIAVADVVEAMSSHRPYRPALGIEQALVEIERRKGTMYDPMVVDACLRLFREKGYAIPV